MKESVELKLRKSDQEEDDECRCGLCCVVIPTTDFSKGGYVCEYLVRGENGQRGCSQYENRPDTCRQYSCQGQRPMLEKILDTQLEKILIGETQSLVYHYEDDEEGRYPIAQSVQDIMASMKRVGVLELSKIPEINKKVSTYLGEYYG